MEEKEIEVLVRAAQTVIDGWNSNDANAFIKALQTLEKVLGHFQKLKMGGKHMAIRARVAAPVSRVLLDETASEALCDNVKGIVRAMFRIVSAQHFSATEELQATIADLCERVNPSIAGTALLMTLDAVIAAVLTRANNDPLAPPGVREAAEAMYVSREGEM